MRLDRRSLTHWVIAAVACTVVLYDVTRKRGDTVSEVLREGAKKWPIIPFAAGAVVAHFWWSES